MESPRKKLALQLIILTILCAQVTDSLRILGLFPYNGKSHFVVCEQVMKGLAARGHQVDVYSHFPQKKPVANYTDYSLAGTLPSVQNNMTFEVALTLSDSPSIPGLLDYYGKPVCDLMHLPIFQKLLKNPPPYDLLIIEVFVANCFLAFGRYLNVPMVLTATAVPYDWYNEPLGNPVNPAVTPSFFVTTAPPMSFLQRLNNFYTTYLVTWSFNYHARQQDAIVRKYFGKDYPNVIDLQKDVALMLTNTHYALNGIRANTPAVVPIGGLHIVDDGDELPKEIKKFLDESKAGFIYFTLGSMIRIETLPKPMLDIFYKVFEKISPIRVLIKVAKPEELPAGLPDNVKTHHWLPQIKVLKHKNVKTFITHGGLLGTQEAVYHGVPLIGIPVFGDQFLNIQAYANKNLAVRLDYVDITEATLEKAISEILNNPVHKNSAKNAGKLFRDTPMKPMDTATFWIEYVARYGKDVLRSPLVDMPWWQSSLLDVYALISFCLLVVLYTFKIFIRKLVNLFAGSRSDNRS